MGELQKIPARMRCPVAPDGSCDFKSIGQFEDKSGEVGTVTVLRCNYCGVGVSMPPIPDVAFLYEGRESQDFQPDAHGIVHWIKSLAFGRQAEILLRQIGCQPDRVLDFGCGSGQFTRCLGNRLSGAIVVGSDFDAAPPADLADRYYSSINRLDADRGTFDVVLAMHVLEHDDDPRGLLARIVAMVRPGGTVVIEVPNIDCVWTKLLGQSWDAWYLPFHRTHFSSASLHALIEQEGLKIVGKHATCVPTMGRSIANWFGSRNSLPFLIVGILLHPIQLALEKVTGAPSALRVIARHHSGG